ncbi:hypothetical protein EJB05_12166 [Eragrostis curvula]|uniref:F-box domain-containing protein n=1 Tax=Eragrostis curvula TaxID=38414 RepID=A0A5J9VRJ4_9POAL|nr:hypothetical protein EJB05_12166 [Eragrostis curvula]
METQPPKAATLTLPADALAAVLARLPARSLAVSRCVCAAWRDLVDEHRLLLPRLLPHSVHGIFLVYDTGHGHPHLFARPTAAGPRPRIGDEFGIDSAVSRYSHEYGTVVDHCDGFVLYTNATPAMFVCNPATRRCVRLPACPAAHWIRDRCAYLSFDPATSPHYKVLVAPHVPAEHHAGRLMEWPPSPWTWHVFSSKEGQWGERTFVREGEAAGTVGGLQVNASDTASAWWFSATQWQGSLYLHFRREYVLRMPLSSDQKYRVIKSPIYGDDSYVGARPHLGKSEKGMYFATNHYKHCQLRVWFLHESRDGTEWVLMHQVDLKPCVFWARTMETAAAAAAATGNPEQPFVGSSWLLDDCGSIVETKKTAFHWSEDESEWDSDDDNIVDAPAQHSDEEIPLQTSWDAVPRVCRFLGFHPYKDVVFLSASYVGMAYHLNSSKLQHLGNMRPQGWCTGVTESFVYTPCLIGDF